MDYKILSEIKGKDVSKMRELVLDNCDSTSIIGLTDEFYNLENLSMINVGLTNLNGLPNLPNLTKLDLIDNKISGDLKYISDRCPKLKRLYLNGNDINHIEDLAPLSHLSDLKYLELQTCPVSSINNYRREVFTLLPNLQFLDGLDQNDEAGNESDAENHRKVNDSSEEEEDEVEDYDNLQNVQIDEAAERNNSPSDEDESNVDSEIESDEEYYNVYIFSFSHKRKFEEVEDDDDE